MLLVAKLRLGNIEKEERQRAGLQTLEQIVSEVGFDSTAFHPDFKILAVPTMCETRSNGLGGQPGRRESATSMRGIPARPTAYPPSMLMPIGSGLAARFNKREQIENLVFGELAEQSNRHQ